MLNKSKITNGNLVLSNGIVICIFSSACSRLISSKDYILKRGLAHLPYILLLLGNQLVREI